MADNDQPPTAASSETGAPESSASDRARASEIKRPSAPQRVRYSLFSRETRAGRFLRALVRGILLVVGLLALGALAVYILLYRPTTQQLARDSRQATQVAGENQQAQQNLDKAQQNLADAQKQSQDAQAQLATEQSHVQVLRAMNAVLTARLAVAKNDKASAVSALQNAQTYLQQVQPLLEKRDATEATALQAIFTLAKTDLDRDLKLADQDLARLQSELDRAEQSLLKPDQ